jgi:hypothetical protein
MAALPQQAKATGNPPTATDVYAATLINTLAIPQSANVVLEGADAENDALTYTVVSAPSIGSLIDPSDDNTAVTTFPYIIRGQTLTYSPPQDFSGVVTFKYQVSDGTSESAVKTAIITVFETHRGSAQQIGDDINGKAAYDGSGFALAISSDGRTVAIGAPNNRDYGTNSGHVRVYALTDGAWQQIGQDIGWSATFGGYSGWSVSISGDGRTLALGAPKGRRPAFTTVRDQGEVRTFRFIDDNWRLRGSNLYGERDDFYGTSISLSSDGKTLAIASMRAEGVNGYQSGHVRVYVDDKTDNYAFTNSVWRQLGGDIDGEVAYDWSGRSVSLSSDGKTVAIGSSRNSGNGSNSGHVRIYALTGGAWIKLGQDIDGDEGDRSGASVSLSSDGQTVAIGASHASPNGTLQAGRIRVYRFMDEIWVQLGQDIEGERVRYSHIDMSVALSGDGQTVAMGLYSSVVEQSGRVLVYTLTDGAWIKRQDIDARAAYRSSSLGLGDTSVAVALSRDGQTVVIGTHRNNNYGTGIDSGHVRVFDLTDSAPKLTGLANTIALVGNIYSFTPVVLDADLSDRLTFSATVDGNALPSWLSINAATGELSGTPITTHVGTLSNIVLSVSDGTSSADLTAFDLAVFADTDDDGVPDNIDAFPNDPAASIDTDGDGMPDGWNEGCNETCITESVLTLDLDDDNDGVLDIDDAFPLDATESVDTDLDGIGNNADSDDDNDGYSDADELANGTDSLLAISVPADNDDDFISDLLDNDDDNDGVLDVDDAFPFDSTKSHIVKNDVDGDGKSDLLWRSSARGWNFLWAMDGTQTKLARPINVVQDDGWLMAGQGDYDGDGKSDILWRNTITGLNFMYLMDGLNIKTRRVLNYVDAPQWELVGSGDFNGDGKGDVLWQDVERGRTQLYLMNGLAINTNRALEVVPDLNEKIVAVGDVNGDGTDDVIWRNQASGTNSIWLMENSLVTDMYVLNRVSVDWTIAGAGDLDGDGTDDIVLRNQADGRNWAFMMENGQIRTSQLINTVGSLDWQIANMGDFDGDGKTDFLWRNEAAARNIVHLMDGLTIKDRGVLRPTDNTWTLAK